MQLFYSHTTCISHSETNLASMSFRTLNHQGSQQVQATPGTESTFTCMLDNITAIQGFDCGPVTARDFNRKSALPNFVRLLLAKS